MKGRLPEICPAGSRPFIFITPGFYEQFPIIHKLLSILQFKIPYN